MTVAAVDGAGIGLALVLLQVPLALALAFLTFLFAFVPIVGAIVAGAVAVLIARVSNGVTDALLVLAVVVIFQQMEGNLLGPVIIGKVVRLHPAVVLVGVTAGTFDRRNRGRGRDRPSHCGGLSHGRTRSLLHRSFSAGESCGTTRT
ncbi:AI-2E family transporter [Nonomuraea turkmeniaca]|uniref:AI-2E family transporter n=1 Tax=Nonomuraea turkmeniaca TaxID=103838 RepID=UPI001FEC7D5D|nr:AI-2E family transporter [Nonomuraea turkmeniaca]